ncbi:MAG: hypothetical protein AAGD32_06125 [Planctomycetota bacterium]
MPTEQATIQTYRIHRCGFYRRGAKSPEFGELDEVLTEARSWAIDGKLQLGDTCTFTEDAKKSWLGVYAWEMRRDASTGTWAITLWNRTPKSAGGVMFADAAGTPSARKARTSAPKKNDLPGYPTHFWLDPASSSLVTVQLDEFPNGHQNLIRWLTGFLRNVSPYRVKQTHVDEDGQESVESVTWRELGASDEDETPAVQPSFVSKPVVLPGKIKTVQDNRAKIKRVLIREQLVSSVVDDRGLIERLLSRVDLDFQDYTPSSVRVEAKIPVVPSQEDLDEMLSGSESAGPSGFGFEIEGVDKPVWIDHASTRESRKLDIVRDKNNVPAAESILRTMKTLRKTITNRVKQDLSVHHAID